MEDQKDKVQPENNSIALIQDESQENKLQPYVAVPLEEQLVVINNTTRAILLSKELGKKQFNKIARKYADVLKLEKIESAETFELVEAARKELKKFRTSGQNVLKDVKDEFIQKGKEVEKVRKDFEDMVEKAESKAVSLSTAWKTEQDRIELEKENQRKTTYNERARQLSAMGILLDTTKGAFVYETMEISEALVMDSDPQIWEEDILLPFKELWDAAQLKAQQEEQKRKDDEKKLQDEKDKLEADRKQLEKDQQELKDLRAMKRENALLSAGLVKGAGIFEGFGYKFGFSGLDADNYSNEDFEALIASLPQKKKDWEEAEQKRQDDLAKEEAAKKLSTERNNELLTAGYGRFLTTGGGGGKRLSDYTPDEYKHLQDTLSKKLEDYNADQQRIADQKRKDDEAKAEKDRQEKLEKEGDQAVFSDLVQRLSAVEIPEFKSEEYKQKAERIKNFILSVK